MQRYSPMKPQPGKWYQVRKVLPDNYEGPALCAVYDAYESSQYNARMWRFVLPDIPDRLQARHASQNLVRECDVLNECNKPLTATEAIKIVNSLGDEREL